MKTKHGKNNVRTCIRQSATAVLLSASMMGAGSAFAGLFEQVRPFEYSNGTSESYTSLYAHMPQRAVTLSRNSFVSFTPALAPRLLSASGEPVALRSFSRLNPGGYYRPSGLDEGESVSGVKEAFYTVLGVALLGGSLYVQAKEIELGLAEIRN